MNNNDVKRLKEILEDDNLTVMSLYSDVVQTIEQLAGPSYSRDCFLFSILNSPYAYSLFRWSRAERDIYLGILVCALFNFVLQV